MTIRSYEIDLVQFFTVSGDQPGKSKVDQESIKKIFRIYVEELFICGLNKKSISGNLSTIKSFFKYCKELM